MTPLITPRRLESELAGTEAPTVLDVRWNLLGPAGAEEYAERHLPGALFVDVETELAAPPGGADGGRHPLPEPEVLQRALRGAGVDAHRPVVVYDSGDGSVAARAWWLLRWAGHSRAFVLDGGFAAWVAAGLPVTTEVPDPVPGDFVVRPGNMPVTDADGARRLARTGVLLDARAGERYRGETEPVDPRAGHVPGAYNAPAAEHVADGAWRSPAELAKRFTELGVTGNEDVGAYCGSGINACSVVLALEHAGLRGPENPAVLYPGSWSEWSSSPERPVVTGAEPG
ncbi:sulfurtransferase [Actinopolyspora erythraea]|uniref:Sulfurtransferase n=1 Tax=Actinopolyspora erythraea TaxID=414996 RepID=A0A099D6W2_9ACTN|nr:sulfurtransferase [Actinopolyspora erythraea]ASU79518.1 sulfurtransferase [Actinopolyspora erythraea]KGI81095.1 3-mercaptopyruvate sulfurtransferase [Actinopolyspora erythraea]